MHTDVISFLKNNIEPLEDSNFGLGYRAAVTLKDGTFLPCVIFRNPSTTVNLAIRRFKEELSGKSIFNKSSGLGYWDIVKTFVTNGNCVNYFDIIKVEKSKYAFPLQIQNQIRGETSMSWTAFIARFKDGRVLGFGTTWNIEFFDLPTDYQAENIIEIVNHAYLLKSGEIALHRSFNRITRKDEMAEIYGSKPFFECFIDNL